MSGAGLKKWTSDVVQDMRSRNLLPLVILLIVGILAAPFLIKGSGGESVSTPSLAPDAGLAEAPPETLSAVVAYQPGLRDYKERLSDLAPSNPFRQQFQAAASSASAAVGESGGLELTPPEGGGGGGGDLPGGGGSGGGGNGGSEPKEPGTKTKYFTYDTDVLVGQTDTPLERRNKLPMFAYLPSDQVPALSYMGIAGDGKQAVFLVSEDVTDIGGEGTCFPDATDCQLLGITVGQTAQLTYGGVSYTLQVVRIKRRTTTKPAN
jgi:hypothetical protein